MLLNLNEKTQKILDIALKVLSILLLGCYFSQLYTSYAIDAKQVLPDTENILIILLRTLTSAAVGLMILVPWFKPKNASIVAAGFSLVSGILNLLFFNENMIAWGKGRESSYPASLGWAYEPVRSAFFIVEQVLLIIMGIYFITKFVNRKEFKNVKILLLVLAILLSPIMFMNPSTVQSLNIVAGFTKSKANALDMSGVHILYLTIPFILIIASFFIMHKEDENAKRFTLTAMALGAFGNFFYCSIINGNGGVALGNLPFHLCNMAVILILVAFAFKVESVFYFTLFCNVLGTIFAMLMPDTSTADHFYMYGALRFWYNHILAFALPLMGLTLGVFPRPKFKQMLKAIGIFACYFLMAMILNAWLSNYGTVNYFFINDNFFFDKIGGVGTAVKDNFVWEFYIGKLSFKFYPLFQLIVFTIFVALMFVCWYVYDFFYNVADSHKAIHYKKLLAKELDIDFKKTLNGRSIHEPLVLEDVGMIEIKHFTKVYSGSKQASVEDLNLTIHDGEVYGFLGHNGAGKSTTIKSLVGIQSITSGQMIVDGFDVAKQPVEAKLRIGYVSDNHAVYERLTGREYINYIADLYMVPQKERDERIEKYTKMFKLEDAIDREIKSYSHGMKQKIVVISSLIHDPKVWILDEPLTGLDPTSAYQIKECMREHASRGNIVFFSSHVIEVVEKICTSICIIGHGKLQCQYSLKELKEKGLSLEDLYLKYVSNEERIH